jgi:Fibronectin type III-like domain
MSPGASLFDDIMSPAGGTLDDGPDWAGVRASLDSEGIALTPPLLIAGLSRAMGDPASIGAPPRQLRGFRQVTLRPGQSETVRFTLAGPSVAYWDTATSAWAVAPGTYQVYVGDSSSLANLPLQGRFTLPASTG